MTRKLMVALCVFVLAGCADSEPVSTTPAQDSAEDPVVTTEPSDDETVQNEGDAGGGEAPTGAGGDGPELTPAGDSEVTVNGEPFAATSLLRCEPFDSSAALGLPESEDGEVLDLQVLGDGYILFIGVSSSTAPGDIQLSSQSVSIQGQAIGDGESTGVFETSVSQTGDQWFGDDQAVDGPLMEWTGDRVAGSATLADTFEAADPIEVTFDVVVPEEVQDCSL